MENKKIIIAGGTGFIGQEMTKYFDKSNKIIILTRQLKNTKTNRFSYNSLTPEYLKNVKYINWDGESLNEWVKELNASDLIINLAGKTVNCRYNKKNKKEIFDSRINSTMLIGKAIKQCSQPPLVWINSSSATIYRHAEDRPQDEEKGEIENDFSVQVCKAWEKTFYEQQVQDTRQIALRMAITLGPGGILIPYFNLLKFGLGGRQGNGRQMYSWIHIEDTCRMIEWIFEHPEIKGTYNCSSPNPITNNEFMLTLRKVTGYKIGLPASKWMLKIGTSIIGTETELILKSRWVIPAKILKTNFQFNYPNLEDALKNIIYNIPRKQYHLF